TVSSTSGTLQVVAGRSILTDSANGTSIELQTSSDVLLKAGDAIGTDSNRIEMKEVATVAAISAGVSTAGDIYLRQLSGTNSALEIGTVAGVNTASSLDNTVSNLSGIATSANNNDITVTVASGSLTVTQNVTAHGSGNVDLRTGGSTSDINLNNSASGATVSSTTGTLQLVAGRSILTDSANGTSTELQTSGNVLLKAGDAIGTDTNRIEMKEVAKVTAVSAGASTSGDIYLREFSGTNSNLEIGTVAGVNTASSLDNTVSNLSGITTSANNNDITVTVASGSLTVTQNVTAHGSGNVDLRTGGSNSDINLNNSTSGATVSSSSGTLQLVAGRSILTDSANGTSAELRSSGNVLLKAGDAIGTDTNRIEMKEVATVAAVSAGASAAGDIYLREISGTNSNLENGPVAAVNSTSTLDNTVSNLNGIATSANNNDITLTVAAGSLTVTQNVTAHGSGNVDLRTGGATSDINLNNSTSGATVSSTTGTLQLVAGRGVLTDSANGTSTELQTSGNVLLKAGDAIGGETNRIEMKEVAKVAAVSAGASTSGDIYLRELSGTNNNLEIGTVAGVNTASILDNTVSNLSGITTSANNNDITVTVASGSLTVTQNVTAHGSGNVDLRTGGSASDINLNNSASGATVSSTTGTLQLVAGRSILTDSANGTSTELQTSGNVLLKAGDAIGTDTNRIEMKEVAKVAAVSAGASTAGDIFVRQISGTNSNLEIGTVAGVNTASSLDNTVSNFSGIATSANNNDITVTMASGSLTVTQNVTAHGAGNVDLRTGGSTSDINLNNSTSGATISSTTGTLQLVAGRSILTDSANGTSTELQTSGNVLLKAGDAIGTDTNRIEMKEVAKVAAVSAGASTAGDIYLRQLSGTNSALEIGTVAGVNTASSLDNAVSNLAGIATSANNNDITVTVASGSLIVTQNVTAHGSGNVDLRTGGSTSDINLNNSASGATVSSTSGTLQLVAGRSILTDSANGTSTELQTSGDVLLKAGDAIGTDTNRIEMKEVATVAAVSAGASNSGDIYLRELSGTNSSLEIGTVAGVNTASSLDNTVSNLSGIATSANSNDITVTAASGSLTVTRNITAHGSGNVDLRTSGATSDINLDNSASGATVSSTSGTLQLVAGRSILTDSANGTSTELQTSGNVLLKAGDAIGTDGLR
ncbi:MAG: S-layer family protein, partial [Betaproteobacteria bacterium]|nr:S-layer family protein [Betaproteobacteria bacterium]